MLFLRHFSNLQLLLRVTTHLWFLFKKKSRGIVCSFAVAKKDIQSFDISKDPYQPHWPIKRTFASYIKLLLNCVLESKQEMKIVLFNVISTMIDWIQTYWRQSTMKLGTTGVSFCSLEWKKFFWLLTNSKQLIFHFFQICLVQCHISNNILKSRGTVIEGPWA